METPFVSVIIPVYNDHVRLEICLQKLQEQTYHKSSYEVIVVDNGSDESIEPIIAKFNQVKADYESRQGSYAARNKGISLAKGEILAFIDSDCAPAPDWIEKGIENLLRVPNCGIVGGKVEFLFKDPNHPTAAELYDSMMHFNMKRFIEKKKFTGAGNLFTFRRVFEHVGYFDGTLKSGGDKEWGQRVYSAGYTLVYADDVRVAHPARYSFEQLRQKEIRLVGGSKDTIDWKKDLPPLTWNYESIMEHLPPLPPVFKIMRLKKGSFRTKIMAIALWFIMKYIRFQEKLRIKL